MQGQSDKAMISEEVQDYIQRMREQEEYSDDEQDNKDGKQFMKNISSDINLFFNQIIYSINLVKGKSHINFDKTSQFNKNNIQKRAQHSGKSQLSNQVKQINYLHKEKQSKLQNKPKKPVSSFFLFYQQKSKQLAQQHGQVIGSRIAQIVGDTWNNKLSAEQKQPYNERANADKQRYRDEMSKFIQDHSAQIQQIRHLKRIKSNKMRKLNRQIKDNGELDQGIKQDDDESQVNMKVKGISQRQIRAAQRKNYAHRPKAPVSSFFLFYQDQAKNIATKYGQSVGSRLAKLASNLWKQMKKEQKQKYELAAKVERDRYHQQMIKYKIDYPNQIQNRRKKISNSMKRALKAQTQSLKEISLDSDSLGNLSDDDSSSSSSQSQNSYISSESENEKKPEVNLKVTSKKKQREDSIPHKPKGPICSFFQYYHANLKEFMKKQPGDTQKDAGSQFVRKASLKWKTLSDTEKQPYHQLAKIDRDRYQKDMVYFKINYPEQYENLKLFNKNKQLKNKKKKQAKLNLKELQDIDDLLLG